MSNPDDNITMNTNDEERIAEAKAYARQKDIELEEARINAKEARMTGDRIFRIVFGTLVLIALGIVTYRYLR